MAVSLIVALLVAPATPAPAAATCGNAVACENLLPGTPQSVWDDGTDDPTILGYATQMSVTLGSSIAFKVNTNASAYTIDIYRLGYYQGNGARLIGSVPVTAHLPQTQPACLRDVATDLYDCGNWGVSATWQVPTTVVPGVYIAHLQRTDTGGVSLIPFVVRDPNSHSAVVMQTSDTTWQAYNTYGGASLYQGVNTDRGKKVSYNRPFIDRNGYTIHDYLFANEYPAIRFLEANGVDVSYVSGVDVASGQANLQNHKVYMSVGHDEYWSDSQRNAVASARDAGVNLMFLSGNETYWHTRWEPSIDGTNTAYRTMVCYKDTYYGTQTDPVSPTPTWRDPRFAGFAPENSLSGTMYVGQGANIPLQVTAAQGKLRLWRNTSLATLAPGTTATVSPDLVGYEMDGVVDNGYQPAGQIRASSTTATIPEKLTDFGTQTAQGTITHSFSEYRAASGALVFAAGTIQFAFGLDAVHDQSTDPAIPAIQQLTINLLADMGVQPTSLQSGLVAASASTDHTPPVVTISAPTSTNLTFGSQVTVSGTATDAAGVVGGVEVSLDGGASWHPASGTGTWSYTGALRGSGATAIKVRATDDSLNTSVPVSPTAVTVSGPTMLFGAVTPTNVDSGDASATTLGVVFSSNTDGMVTGVRFYKSTANTGTHTGTLYAMNGTVLATGTFTNETASGWQTLTFASPVQITGGTQYTVAYYAPSGHYSYDDYFFAPGPYTTGPLTAVGGLGIANGVYAGGNAFPTQSYHQSNYWVDPLFEPAANSPLSASAVSPVVGAGSILTTTSVVGRFSKDPGDTAMALSLTAAGGATVAGTSTYNASSLQMTFTPTQPLAYGTTFTATMSDPGLSAPYSWTFTTVAAPRVAGQCPCTLFQDTYQPTTLALNDTADVTLGVAVTPSQNGTITAIRYWKPYGSTTGNTVTLYDGSGTALGTATAASETTVGWQTATFATPVAATAGTTYTAAVEFPQGGYPYQAGAFSSPVTFGPLTAPASAGRYVYGRGVPTNAVTTSYYVDLVFSLAPVPLAVKSTSPVAGAGSVLTTASVTGIFTRDPGGTSTLTLTAPGGAQVSGNSVYDSATLSQTFTPSQALQYSTTYTATLNATGLASPVTWTFTTVGPPRVVGQCPCSLYQDADQPSLVDTGDTADVTLGVAFSPTVTGTITAIRYWKPYGSAAGDPVTLYGPSGAVLGTATAATETTTGWQTATFASPVGVVAGTTYTAAVEFTHGVYGYAYGAYSSAVTVGPLSTPVNAGRYVYGTGLPTNTVSTSYYIDPVLAIPVTATAVSPQAGAGSVLTTATVTGAFNKDPGGTSMTLTLAGAGGTQVAGTTSYDAASAQLTLTPSQALAYGATYTATLNDPSLPAPVTWSFTTVAAPRVVGQCPCSLYQDADQPAAVNTADTADVTLGVAFSPTQNGTVTAIRYWKPYGSTTGNTVTLYDATGTALGTATPVSETTTGWQTATFASPVTVSAGASYTAAVEFTRGVYGYTTGAFATALTVGPLSTPVNAGRYVYGAGMPTNGVATSYYVDPVFMSSTPALTASPVTPPQGAGSVLTSASVTGVFNRDPGNTSATLTLTGAGGAQVAGSSSWDPATLQETFTPSQPLAYATTYTATLNDPGLASPVSWSFTTVGAPRTVGQCPCSLYQDTDQPSSVATGDTADVTVGVAFAPSKDGTISSIRFWKPYGSASGDPVTLYDSAGTALGTATASNETSVGWQTATFATPVSVTAGTTYTAAVEFTHGVYGYTLGAFSSALTVGPLSAPANAGRYVYGAGIPGNAVSSSYYVDPVFMPAVTPAPTVVAASPGGGATSVPVTAAVTATFSESVASATLVLTGPSGAVAGTVSGTGASRTFTPAAPLAEATTYTFAVSGAVTSDGVAQTQSFSESFTTSGVAACPCSLLETTLAPDQPNLTNGAPITLGLKFSPTVNGAITGLRYWRAASNTGTHTGTLYSASGTALASLTFTDGAEGWTQALFSTPVTVTAGAAYYATYYSPNGTYSATTGAFTVQAVNPPLESLDAGGVFGNGDVFPTSAFGQPNYFVDVVFVPAPSVVSVAPASNATGVATTSSVSATFVGPVTPASVSLTVAGPSGSVAGTLGVAGQVATFTPSAALAAATTYTATVAASGTGGTMAPYTWSFTTASPPPTVSTRTPAPGATGVAANTTVSATFAAAVDPTKSTVSLTAGGVGVAGTITTTSTSVTFTPSSVLAGSTTYTATVGATSPSGTAMTPVTWTFTTEAAPTVTGVTPANGATSVSTATTVRATFSKAVSTSSIAVTVTDPSGATVAGALATTSTSGTFTPASPLAPATVYRVAVSATLADGLATTPFTSSFTTAAAVNIFPSTLKPSTSTNSPTPLTVGVKFRSSTAMSISGIRFYLPANWTGTYTVTLWSSTGTKLATATGSPTSTTAGWRTVSLTTPVRIAANTTYVASVRGLTAQYSSTPLAFLTSYTRAPFTVPASGGVRASSDVFPTTTSTTNYFVDVVAAP